MTVKESVSQAPEVPAALLEGVAEALYNSLDPRFCDRPWEFATEAGRAWAMGRARLVAPVVLRLAEELSGRLDGEGARHAV